MIKIYWNNKDITKKVKYALLCGTLGTSLILQGAKLAKNITASITIDTPTGTSIGQEIDRDTLLQYQDLDSVDNSNIEGTYNSENQNVVEKSPELVKSTYAYTIKSNDSLVSLAKAFGCTKDEIMQENGLSSDLIHPNDVINIPYKVRDRSNVKIGIDVSKWNGNIDWDMAKNYIDYAIIRVCDFQTKDSNGNTILDPTFKENMEKCNELGIPVGVYAYTRAFTSKDAVKEANFVLNSIKDYKIEYPVYIDIETKKHQQVMLNNLPQVVSTVETWCKTVEDAGYYVGIYAGDNDMQLLTKSSSYLNQYDKWVARYENNPAAFIDNMKEKNVQYNGQYSMHQAGSVGIVPGVSTDVDVNFSYVDFQEVINNAGLNHLNNNQKTK